MPSCSHFSAIYTAIWLLILCSTAIAAAELLGFTKKMWDKDEEPPMIKATTWNELQPEQQQAAKLLRYDKDDFKQVKKMSNGEEQILYDNYDWKDLPEDGMCCYVLGGRKILWMFSHVCASIFVLLSSSGGGIAWLHENHMG